MDADRLRVVPALPDAEDDAGPAREPSVRAMWHTTLTVAGEPVPLSEIKAALERLSHEHPFLLSGRYAADRAEVRYWDEAVDVSAAVRMGVRLWDEHAASAQLPPWRVVGVEVVDRETFHRRGRYAHERPGIVATGRVTPF
jgi:hypothetical protein